jgi:TIR domain
VFEDVGVFLSHSHSDRVFARRLGNDLISRGIRVWIDNAEISVGDSLLQKIAEGLEKMDYLAVVLSQSSVKSEWVRREVEIAINQEIAGRRVRVLPVLYQECEIPPFLTGKLYADFRQEEDYKASLDMLLRRFRTVSPLQGLLRSALPAFTLHGVVLDTSTLQALAVEGVNIGEVESDLVFASISASITAALKWICEWEDDAQGLEPMDTPTSISSRFESSARILRWAATHGLGSRIPEIYQSVSIAIDHSGPDTGAACIKELIRDYGAPPDTLHMV